MNVLVLFICCNCCGNYHILIKPFVFNCRHDNYGYYSVPQPEDILAKSKANIHTKSVIKIVLKKHTESTNNGSGFVNQSEIALDIAVKN